MANSHRHGKCRLAALALVLGLSSSACAGDDEALRISPVRRTTIATADVDASLHFYRDLLGFTVEYDVEVTDPEQLSLFQPGATKGRAIALRRERLGGSIGLYWTPGLPSPGSCEGPARGGTVSVLLLTDALDRLQQKLKQAGVTFLQEAAQYSASRGPTRAFTVIDPNCVRVAVAQIENETLEESLAK